jgi:hypothetical protein
VVKEWPAEMVTGEPAFWPSMSFTVFCGETAQPINGWLRLPISKYILCHWSESSRWTGIWPADRQLAGLPKFFIRHFLLVYKTVYVNRQIAGGTTFECRWPVH